MLYRNKEVVVIGRAADAPHEANYLREIGCRVTYVSPRPPEGLRPDIPYVQAGKLRVLGDRTVEAVQADSVTLPCEGVVILRPSMAPAEPLPGLARAGTSTRVHRHMAAPAPGRLPPCGRYGRHKATGSHQAVSFCAPRPKRKAPCLFRDMGLALWPVL